MTSMDADSEQLAAVKNPFVELLSPLSLLSLWNFGLTLNKLNNSKDSTGYSWERGSTSSKGSIDRDI
jgi:hypothetical protein